MSISSTKPFLLTGIVEMDTERGEPFLMGRERCNGFDSMCINVRLIVCPYM